jgi:hypothetical protein
MQSEWWSHYSKAAAASASLSLDLLVLHVFSHCELLL